MTAASRESRPTFPRLLYRIIVSVAAAVAGIIVLYLAAMNTFLETTAFRSLINFDPDTFRIEYRSAYSIVPGSVHVDALQIRGRDGSVEWILELDRCDFRVSFVDLARRRFHAHRVRGDGLSLRARLRLDNPSAERAAALPPVPGFVDPPTQDPGPPEPPVPDARYKLWGIELDDVVAEHVRELWIDTLRFSGDLRVVGRWLFRPARWLDVGPAVVQARILDISSGARHVVTDVQGEIDARVDPFDIREVPGDDILSQVSAKASLHGTVHVGALARVVSPGADLSFEHADGPFDTDFRMNRGVMAAGTRMEARLPESQLSANHLKFRGSVHATIEVPVDGNDRIHGTAELTNVAIGAAGARGVTAKSIHLATRDLAIDGGRPRGHLAVDSGEALLGDLTEIGRLLPWPPGTGLERGAASLSTHVVLSFPALSMVGHARMDGSDVRLRAGSKTVSGRFVVTVSARERAGTTDLSGSTLAFDGQVSPRGQDSQGQPWWARVDVTDFVMRSSGRLAFETHVHVTARDASPCAAVLAAESSVPEWLINAVPLNQMDASGTVRANGTALDVRSLEARGAGDSIRFAYSKRQDDSQWVLLVNEGILHVGLDAVDGGTHIELAASDGWFTGKVASLEAHEAAAR